MKNWKYELKILICEASVCSISEDASRVVIFEAERAKKEEAQGGIKTVSMQLLLLLFTDTQSHSVTCEESSSISFQQEWYISTLCITRIWCFLHRIFKAIFERGNLVTIFYETNVKDYFLAGRFAVFPDPWSQLHWMDILHWNEVIDTCKSF